MTVLDVLDASASAEIAALCARALDRPPVADEIRGALFARDQPAIVRGDPNVGIVAAVPEGAGGYLRLMVVDPRHQGQGHGSALLAAAEGDLTRGHATPAIVTVGADAPYYLVPGVETTQTAMLCLLERRHYSRQEANFNMDVELASLPEDPVGPTVAGPADRDEVEAFTLAHWSNWRAEVLRALDKGSLIINRDGGGISGFCAWNVNRRGLVGPVAVRPDLMGKGTGGPMLLGALHQLRADGWERIEVSWVGPIIPYARVGGTVGRVFFVYRKTFQP